MTVDINRPHVAPQSAVTDSVPEWVKDAVFYQIFPERFANGDPSIDPEGVVPWDTPPSRGNFFGGDLAGIAAHLDHIEALGANAIYLTPIFEADTNHRYDTADYFRIDHRLGDLEAFRRFVVAAHDRGIRVVLDAVFNHCGEGHWAFRHLHAHREDSPYRDWFTYDSLPLTREPEANYATCEGCKYLPKLNHANQQVRDYLIDVGRHWLGEGIDGWRLDMPFLMPHDFWRDFRRAIKSEDEDCYIVAEVWEEATEWLHGDLSDGAMNYPLRSIILDAATGADEPSVTGRRLKDLYAATPDRSRQAMLNLLGSHDTPRVLTLLDGDPKALRIAVALLLTSPGAPMIYYGDEIGLRGGGDPDCRGAMPWEPSAWDLDLLEWHRMLIALRKQNPALSGYHDEIAQTDSGLLLRRRSNGEQTVWVVANTRERPLPLSLGSLGGSPTNLMTESRLDPESTVQVPSGGVMLIGAEPRNG